MTILTAVFCPPCWAATETVRDEFNTRSYSNHDGTQNWAADWVEIGENDGPTSGQIQIVDDQSQWQLRIQNENRGIQRGVDLSGAVSATLSFVYRRSGLDNGSEYVSVQVSNNGGSSWVTLASFSGPQNDNSYQSASYDLSAYLSSQTLIRLMGYNLESNDRVYFDNIQISYEVPDTPQLIAHYALEGDVTDSSGNGHDGGSTGTVGFERARNCDGVALDGNGYLSVPDHAAFDLQHALTITAWFNAASLSVAGHDTLYTIVSKDTNSEFHVTSDGRLNWWWQGGEFFTASPVVTPGVWYHFAAVYSRIQGVMRLYLNGAEVASYPYSSPLPTNNDPFFIGTDINTVAGGGGAEYPTRRFQGLIDEVRIYNHALTPAEILALVNETDPCQTLIDHFEIRHDGHALTCRPEEVTVRACADADCTSSFDASAVTVTLAPAGWLGGDQQTFTDSGTFRLRHTTAGIVTLGIADSSLTPQHPSRCYENGVEGDCTLEFHDAGFVFDVPDLTSCQASPAVAIRAVRRDDDTQTCVGIESFANTIRTVGFWSAYAQPTSGTLPLAINGVAVAGASPGTGVTLSFDAAASAALELSYADAGELALNARFVGSGDEAGLVMTGADQFVVVPHHLGVSATTDGSALLNNANSSGSPHWPAGEDFHVAVSGACADGTVTPNFAGQTLLTPTECNPACGTLGNATLAATDFVNGVAAPDNVHYGEVGTLKIEATAANYLGSGIDVSGVSDVIGRFTPHHFAVALNTPVFQSACQTGAFTYLGEPFGYQTEPTVAITAQNKQNGTTQNYAGPWWKITDGSLSGKAYRVFNGTVETSGLPGVDPLIEDLGGGLGRLTFSAGEGIAVARTGPVAPFDAEIGLEISLADEDGVTPSTNPIRFGEAIAGGGIEFS
ncbi:MAG: LamG domain-containing protein, partial [Deltaproteobacteria bacterium]|nr:LamG domain-containing protein [Deltaproteobacteria bacterium]